MTREELETARITILMLFTSENASAFFVITDVGLFASVGPRMYGQGTSLNKALVTICDHAMIKPLIGVYVIMAAEIRLAFERLPT
jgi:hypothetical protein